VPDPTERTGGGRRGDDGEPLVEPIVEMRGVSKSFGELTVLDSLDFTVQPSGASPPSCASS